MRKVFCILAAVVMAAFALPGIAATPPAKQFSLEVTAFPDYISNAPFVKPPTRVTLKFTNLSPPSTASSNISSLSATVSGLVILNDPNDPLHAPNGNRNGTITVTSPTSVTVTNISGPLQAQEFFTLTLYVSSCGDGEWDGSAFSGSGLNGGTFTRMGDLPGLANLKTPIKCGDIACATGFTVPDFTNPGPNDPGHVAVTRGTYDEDGTACDDLGFYFTNTIPFDKEVHARWPESGLGSDPFVALSYTINTPSGYSTTTPPTLSAAWLNTDGSSTNTPGTADFGPILLCLTPRVLPAPYGTLAADVQVGDKSIKIDTSTGVTSAPTIPPTFPIVIVDKDDPTQVERMEVTKTTTNTWTVTRGATPTSHAAGARVMSTSMPIVKSTDGYSAQYVGFPAQMCLAAMQQNQLEDLSQYSATIFDFGDGWVRLP